MSVLIRSGTYRGSSPNYPALYRSILGSNAKVILHAARGITLGAAGELGTWADLVTGNAQSVAAVSAGARPLYAADGSKFGGKPVVKCVSASGRYALNTALGTGIFPAGSFPYWIARMAVDATVNNRQVFGLSNAFNSANKIGPFTVTGGTFSLWALSATRTTGTAYSLTAAQTVEWGCDGTNAQVVVNGAATSAAFATTYATNPAQRLTIGGDDQGGGVAADTSWAVVIGCLAKPSASELARIRVALAREYPA